MKNKKGIELEYVAIREELVNITNSKDQIVLAMYSLCITILGFVTLFKVEEVIGLIYLVLIPFQALINTKLFHIARCGAYIKVYIEPEIKGLKWEKIIHEADNKFNHMYRFNLGNIQLTRNLAKYGASVFAIFVFLVYLCNNSVVTFDGIKFCHNNIIMMCIYLFFSLFVFYLNRKGTNFQKVYNTYVDIFMKMSNQS